MFISTIIYFNRKCAETNEFQHKREDHCHVLKRIMWCLRSGLIPGIDLCCFREALHDPKTGIKYEALTGKQNNQCHIANRYFQEVC